VEFGVEKELVEKCGVLNCIATRFAEILFIVCAKILIIIIKLNSEVFKCRLEVIIIIKLRFEILDCPCELQTCQSLPILEHKNVTI
jgi:hypothetical protein